MSHTTRSSILSALLLVFVSAPSLGAQLTKGQGSVIGNSAVPAGDWPLPLTPPGNPFEGDPNDPYSPLPNSATEAKVRLGKLLFWDEQVSSDNTMACGTCHFPSAGGTDPRGTFQSSISGSPFQHGALGMVPQDLDNSYIDDVDLQTEPGSELPERRVTNRNPPSMIGSSYFSHLFWDGRAGSNFAYADGTTITDAGDNDLFPDFAALEAQAVDPPVSNVEMANDRLTWSNSGPGPLENKLGDAFPLALATPSTVPGDLLTLVSSGKDYDTLFDEAFLGDLNFGGVQGVTRERFALAVASYERTLVPNQAPIDTDIYTGLSKPDVLAGFDKMFFTENLSSGSAGVPGEALEGGCFFCHSSTETPQLKASGGTVDPLDELFSNGKMTQAIGAPGPAVAVRTPSLRNVALKTSFFHNGSIKTLEDLIDFYNQELVNPQNPGTPSNPNVFTPNFPFNPPLDATGKAQVIEFLHALTDPRVRDEIYPFDRPDLYAERLANASNLYGAGSTVPSGGTAPSLIANMPYLGNDSVFKVGVKGGPPSGTGAIAFSLRKSAGPEVWVNMTPAFSLGMYAVPLDGDGVGTFKVEEYPISLGTAGTKFHAQWILSDPGGTVTGRTRAATFVLQ